MLPPFPLAEWELPAKSNIPQSAPATIRFPIGTLDEERPMLGRVLRLQHQPALLLVRSEHEEDEASWTPIQPFTAQIVPLYGVWSLDEWLDSRDKYDYGRVVWYKDALAVLHPNGHANWYDGHWPTPFRWHNGERNWTFVPVYYWKVALEEEWQNPRSDTRFAYNWAFMSNSHRHEICWQSSPAWSAFADLLYLLLAAHSTLNPEIHYKVSAICWKSSQGFSLRTLNLSEVNDNQERPCRRGYEWLVDWAEALNSVFCFPPLNETTENYPCVRRFFDIQQHELIIERDRIPISQHERMEALLSLREWAHGKVPDELLATLQ